LLRFVNAFIEVLDRQPDKYQMRLEEVRLAEIFAVLNQAVEVANRPVGEVQEWIRNPPKELCRYTP